MSVYRLRPDDGLPTWWGWALATVTLLLFLLSSSFLPVR